MPLFVDHLDLENQTSDIADDHEGDFWYNTTAQAFKARLAGSVIATFATLAGGTFTGDISVPDEAYGSGWNGSMEVPTKNAVYDKIETLTPSKYILPLMIPETNKVVTTTGVTGTNIMAQVLCPRTGTYLIRFWIKVVAVSGTPSTVTVSTRAATALSKVAVNSGTYTTLFAANTVIATMAKGSTFAAGDFYSASTGTFSLTADDLITVGTGANQFWIYKVDNATSVTIYGGAHLVEQ